MESTGVTWRDPLALTGPMPSMLTSVAFVVCQVRVVDWPFSIVLGLAESEAVGAGGGAGGGGGGGATFFAQAPQNRIAPRTNTKVDHRFIGCFTSFLQVFCAPGLWRAVQSTAGRTRVSRKTVQKLGSESAASYESVTFALLEARSPQIFLRGLESDSLNHFQLQLGWVLLPLNVNCFTFVPSASILQI